MTDFISYIQSPSVYVTFPDPIACNVRNVFFNLWIFQIQLWHSTIIPKAQEVRNLSPFALQRQFIDIIPVQIFGFFTLFQNILKCKKLFSGMVEHRIHNHLHSAVMCFLYQLLKLLLCSKGRIDLIIINGIVLMTGIRFEAGRHVYNVDSQILNMIQMIDNSSEITMQIIHRRNGRFIPQLFVYRLGCCKTGWKDLIHDLICCPIRDLKHFFLPKVLRTVKHSVSVRYIFLIKLIVAVIYSFSLHIYKFKEITETDQVHPNLCFIIIIKL